MGNVLGFPTRFRPASTLDFGISLAKKPTNVPCLLGDHNVADIMNAKSFFRYGICLNNQNPP
jgi:hypothetical protein